MGGGGVNGAKRTEACMCPFSASVRIPEVRILLISGVREDNWKGPP